MTNPMASSYQMSQQNNFSQFSDNAGYGHLGDMSNSYSDTPRSMGGGMVGMRGPYSNPGPSSSYGSHPPNSSGSFSMPYDPPNIQQHQQHQMQNGGGGGSNLSQSHSMQSMPALASIPHTTTTVSNKTIHSCSYCGLVLSSANALIEHKRIHTGDRPFECHICGKRFTQKAHLNIHKRTHTGEKPYACNICNKRFAQSSHLVSHKRIHTGEKPFVCGLCHMGFTQKQRLDAHLKKHLLQGGLQGGTEEMVRIMASGTKVEQHSNRGRPPVSDENFAHMMGHGMPYIKQEVDDEAEQGSKSSGNGNFSQSQPPASREGHTGPTMYDSGDDGNGEKLGNVDRENGLADGDEQKGVGETGKTSYPTFSSEGMFLHPSGYVAYGGIEDNEDVGYQGQNVQQIESANQHGASRRKPSVVRKLPMDPASTTSEPGNPDTSERANQIQRFSPLQSGPRVTSLGSASELEDFHDQGETVDDKNDPPYHANSSRKPNTPGMMTRRASMPQQDQHETKYSNGRNMNAVGSHSQYSYHPVTNGMDREGSTVPQETLSYVSPRASTESGTVMGGAGGELVKVNNRVSLVNFTAEELLTHMMKRDDVHKCEFCCLIFQDAAMYHIHRNMHDRSDLRRCNMCGKMLADKYDFTAHFLSMHKT
ncbi:zinc finger protein [Elysia marginata]|uniref:Zinc finger protein n=1 Tax=Elysia marginata TaxID=1093978 RepID=A0AAV4FG10_9GAST|nr:zinc finger protein [Elysia marginata]